MVRTLIDIVRLQGWNPDGAHSGEEAVEAVRENAYQAVLMDVRMAGINGVDAFKAMKALRPGDQGDSDDRVHGGGHYRGRGAGGRPQGAVQAGRSLRLARDARADGEEMSSRCWLLPTTQVFSRICATC